MIPAAWREAERVCGECTTRCKLVGAGTARGRGLCRGRGACVRTRGARGAMLTARPDPSHGNACVRVKSLPAAGKKTEFHVRGPKHSGDVSLTRYTYSAPPKARIPARRRCWGWSTARCCTLGVRALGFTCSLVQRSGWSMARGCTLRSLLVIFFSIPS